MDSLIYLYGALVLVAAALAAIAIRAPHPLALRGGAVVLAAALMSMGYAGFAELLGRPKPADLEWAARNTSEATVLAAEMREGEAIYLWLQLDHVDAPRAYVLPWSMEAARQLHQAQGRAEKAGTEVQMHRPFRDADDGGERMFYAAPQPALPPKLVHAR
ncbi:MAG: hypothetical protein JSU82_18080 [Rhodospirillales bacterium]|nr:MAG: hypothetical protein JSU82_18080 [Rhodospirillales bacterium]